MSHNPPPHDSPDLGLHELAEPPVQFVLAPPIVRSIADPVVISNDAEDARTGWRRMASRFGGDAASGAISFAVHTILLVILALIAIIDDKGPHGPELVLGPLRETLEEDLNNSQIVLPDVSISHEQQQASKAIPSEVRFPDAPNIESPFAAPTVSVARAQPTDLFRETTVSDLLEATNTPVGGGFEGRTPEQRARLVVARGGTQASEDAVEQGLAWLVEHQRRDGSWHLNHQEGPCEGRCPHPGTVGTSTGATALALLPFLGAGYTHKQGKYKEVVNNGLYYLTGRMIETPHGGDLQEGTMYSQGIATIALCEAYGMTGDEQLKPYAQKAVNFIVRAQHPRGGWRYVPGSPGDTTVTGWQVMALKSAKMSGLYVPSHTTELAKEYLDSVQDSGGVFYGYQRPGKDSGPTAVAILLRMYLGWQRYDSRLVGGFLYLANQGPSTTDMYFNYYATQVLHHFGGSEWDRWNVRMRDFLVARQAPSGHEKGSWYFVDRHGTAGGRLYTTAICTMILEVYYRHMPLYGEDAVEDAF
ncbi:MAG: terpene cyclase/mutase family protein [Planctomycetaceae bacterium]|nr:terpene cyclase/mutase family protein [Planctomycetales bacterium]MCB9924041.1 terpene cyclase/mutase family protein [Planctomycetaceae bacterium]